MRASVKEPLVPQSGQVSSTWSARKRCLQFLQSTMGSVKWPTWPLATQARGFIRMAASKPTISSRSRILVRHQARLMLFFSSTPKGP